MNARTKTAPKLGLETLEAREVPATTVQNLDLFVLVTADNGGSDVTISRPLANQPLWITDNETGKKWKIPQGPTDFKKVVFVGGSGRDFVSATLAYNPVNLFGKGGNDVLTGGRLKDRLDGGAGNDNLTGGAGNDTMYGRGGLDVLFGRDGSDFLDDGGSAGDSTDGGNGDDFLARKPVRFGTFATDIEQASSPTCWVLAPLSGAAQGDGIDLASRITYVGNGEYRVKLMNEDGGYCYQYVSLEGGRLSFEPDPNGDESWVIIFQRAILQELDIDWSDLGALQEGGDPADVLPLLTGRPVESHTPFFSEFSDGILDDIHQAVVVENKLVCLGTRQYAWNSDEGDRVSTPKLLENHAYDVLNINFQAETITLWNPWGNDGRYCFDGDDNGIVKISFDDFFGSINYVAIS
jgi:hypothetical protein